MEAKRIAWRHFFLVMTLAGLVCLAQPAPAAAADTLMRRVIDEPVIPVDPSHRWRAVHVANAAILTPEESPDERWRLYVRGSGFFPEEGGGRREHYHDSIGLLVQEAGRFSPLGPWREGEANPVLTHGPKGSYDARHLLDCSPVWGRTRDGQDVLLMLYKAVSYADGASLAGADSTDGGLTFSKFRSNPLQRRVGPCDVVCHGNRYYVFYGDMKFDEAKGRPTEKLKTYLAVTDDLRRFADAPRRLVLDTGPQGAFDSVSVHGGRVFRLDGRWYMVYQCSDRHTDYPDRFHVARSDDLIDWAKVENSLPFFERGEAGAWDEGAIWYGEAFKHEGVLYMYYEGWGSGRPGYDRSTPYARGGRSQIGLASVPVDRFLDWCRGR